MMQSSFVRWVALGDYIERRSANNSKLKYGIELIQGVNNKGEFCLPKANTDGINLKPYKVVQNGDFVYNPSRLNIGSLAYRTEGMCIVSHLYVVFHLNAEGCEMIIPEFLLLFFKRAEFLRLVTYLNYGSQRPEFNFYDMSEIKIPLPSIDKQRELVEAWRGLREMKEENERIVEPLESLCRSYLQDLKYKYPLSPIGAYIEPCDERNPTCKNYPVLGINRDKRFMPTVANITTIDISKYKVVHNDYFVFSGMQTGRDVCIRIALYTDKTLALVSPAYTTFTIKKDIILPEYFFMYFNRCEMDRFGWFISDSSVRSNLDWERFVEIEIPIPPIEIQRAIVEIYHCADESRKIAAEANALSTTICPALMQKVING